MEIQKLDREGLSTLFNKLIEAGEKSFNQSDDVLIALFGGFKKKKLYVYSADSNGGKTLWLVDQLVNCGIKHKKICWYHSVEEPTEDIYRLLLSNYLQIDRNKIITGDLEEEEKQKIIDFTVNQDFGNILITFGQLPDWTAVEKILQTNKVDCFFFDYLATFANPDGCVDADYLVARQMSQKLHELAVSANCAIITATQLNANSRDKKKQSADIFRNSSYLQGSASVQNAADVAMIVSSQQYFNDPENEIFANLKQPEQADPRSLRIVIDIYKNRCGMKNRKVFAFLDTFKCKMYPVAVFKERTDGVFPLEEIPNALILDQN